MVHRIHSIVLLFALLIGGAGMNYAEAATYSGTCGAKPATMKPDYFRQVELYSNFMHLISYTYREDGKTLSGSNEQFLYRVK